jgi:hypothetical protein
LDNWSSILYNLQKVMPHPFMPFIFCSSLIFIGGSFFLINLMLAVMIDSFI